VRQDELARVTSRVVRNRVMDSNMSTPSSVQLRGRPMEDGMASAASSRGNFAAAEVASDEDVGDAAVEAVTLTCAADVF
jgi:hypothetical protein